MRVMVIDDDGDFVAMVATQLERSAGMTVESFKLGRLALARLANDDEALPDVVLCDLLLPDISGFELVSELRRGARTSSLPCIVASARSGLEEHARAEEVGADAFLAKPFKNRQLVDLLYATVQTRGAR